jgi:hypothetical protein
MAVVARDTIRRLGKTTEWFIVDQIAKKVPPSERFFLLYEMKGPRAQDPRVARARSAHPQGRCIDAFILVTVSRAQLEFVLGGGEWLEGRIERVGRLEANQALCAVVSDDPSDPTLLCLSARAVNRPGASPTIIDR